MADSERETSDAPRPQRYAGGLPWTGTRPLDTAEVAAMRRQLRLLRGQVIATGLGLATTAVAAALLADLPSLSPIGGPAAAWLATVGLAGLLGCLLYARGGWRVLAALGSLYLAGVAALGELRPQLLPRPQGLDAAVIVGMILLGTSFVVHATWMRLAMLVRARAIEADLRAGRVERYAGPSGSQPPATLRRLVRDLADPRGHVRIDVLPTARLVVRVNGRRCERWRPAHVTEIAATQPHAMRVGLPRELAAAPSDPKLKLERRSLSPAERAELAAHARRLRERWAPVAAVTLAVVAVVGGHVVRAQSLAEVFDVVSLLWYGLAIVAWAGYLRRLRAAHKLRCDERLRWVVTVRNADAPDDGSPPQLEVLPVSQLAWTEHARPAGWRVDEI